MRVHAERVLRFAQDDILPVSNDKPLPLPQLTDDRILRVVTGVRPVRRGSVRVEKVLAGNATIVHNYGHGGAGVTLSWGSAEEAVTLIEDLPPSPVAVIGAGVVGLATTAVLQERGHAVHLYARDFSPNTTSDIAGAEWSPEAVAHGSTHAERERFSRMLRRSWLRFETLEGQSWGVTRRPAYAAEGVELGLEHLPSGLAPRTEKLDAFPFEQDLGGGRLYQTFLIEPPIYMPRLFDLVVRGGAIVTERAFDNPEELLSLDENIIFNCTGLGGRTLFGDQTVDAVRGHLVHFMPDPISCLFNFAGGYIFPRTDVTVVGTSFETEFHGAGPDPAVAAEVVARARRFLRQV